MDSLSLYAALYLIGFAALHSLLASLPAKNMAKRLFGSRVDPWYPVFFSASAVVTILPLVALLIHSPGKMLYIIPRPWIWLFFFLQIVIGLASLRAFLDAPHRFLIRAQLAGPGNPEAFSLGIRGIYCWIRDPFLLSGVLLIWLTPFMTENLLAVYILTTIYLFLGSLHWESRLHAQFGDEYESYKNQVPRMIPSRDKRWKGCKDKSEL
ncbi:MAG: isoprenylcysteine carboxylmethyltransferase family protein [Methanothrix sp.]|jgi:protein-S-isoprenylcysteine O-methyltransferase Ste14|nr:isoprenylcysteine carboxylmethyltransferase family protein [Methanothrix sp.]